MGLSSFGKKDELVERIAESEQPKKASKRATPAKSKSPPPETPSTSMRVAELKSWLSEHGLSTKGLKDELVSRYNEAKDKLSGALGASPDGEEEEPEPAPTKRSSRAAAAPVDNESRGDDSDAESFNQAAADAAENASIWPVVVALTVIVL